MKKLTKILVTGAIITGFLFPNLINAQGWSGHKKEQGFWKNWTINTNAGLTSFFGDLSIYDSDIVNKFAKESGPAFGGILTKQFSPKFGVSGQLLFGNLKGSNHTNMSFQASFIEYNFHGRLYLFNIIWPDNLSKLGMVAYGGIGQFLFNSTRTTIKEGISETSVNNTGTPEFAYFFGSGLSYNINEKYGVTLDVALRQAQNDRLDNYVRNDNYDYYTYLSLGFTYNLDSMSSNNKRKVVRGGYTNGKIYRHLPMRRRR